jgi:hypothetical protein
VTAKACIPVTTNMTNAIPIFAKQLDRISSSLKPGKGSGLNLGIS